ncbi:MAG TPA: potassium channel protein [Syntrophorhabdales bacterium]|nr:potassium channel protein [Syntrophorhabdales bacterium]
MRNDIGKRLKNIVLIIVLIILVGMLGYKVIGGPNVSLLDALYMTAITITTVGYSDVVGAGNTTAGKVFTIVYLFFSVGTIFYLFTVLAAFMVEGEVRKVFKRRTMEKRIEKMRDHYIVCGIGMVGLYIVHELYEMKRPQVVIDMDTGKFDLLKMRDIDVPVLLGDATENELLEKAMVKEAEGLFATTNSDNDNIVIALTAKQLNPRLRVICRCNDTKNTDKIKRAGADSVVALNYIGGLRMAAEMIRPHATDFMESLLRDKEHALRVEEVGVPEGSPYAGKRIEELELANMGNLLLLAIRNEEGEWIYNPPPSLTLEKDMRLIVLATPEERQILYGALTFEPAQGKK